MTKSKDNKCHFDMKQLEKLRENLTCEYCGISRNDSTDIRFQIDHIVPKRFGGTEDQENLAISCVTCNLEKREKLGYKTLAGRAGKSDLFQIKDGKVCLPTRGL